MRNTHSFMRQLTINDSFFSSYNFIIMRIFHYRQSPQIGNITNMRCISTQFIDNKKGAKKITTSCVKRMMPPPQQQQQEEEPKKQQIIMDSSSLPSSSSFTKSTIIENNPLLNVEEMITTLKEVFVDYQKHLCSNGSDTSTTITNLLENYSNKNNNSVSVPFYPPVPLEYLEEKFQPLLQRLLPAGGVKNNESNICITGNNVIANKNRENLMNRIKGSGIFTLSSPPRGKINSEIGNSNSSKNENLFIRIRPGVRELASDIAIFLFSLEPTVSNSTRKAVPLAIIRRMSLSPSAISFIRNELSGDIKRLLLVYENNIFILKKNGAMVQLQNSPEKKVEKENKPEPIISSSIKLTHEQSLKEKETKKEVTDTNMESKKKLIGQIDIEIKQKEEKNINHSITPSFISNETDTVIHMGKRFIAPSAMERYRLSQRLAPILEFIPVAASVISNNKKGNTIKDQHYNYSNETNIDDGFVDFVSVRNRVIVKYPHLASLLVLNFNDVQRRHETQMLSALNGLGIEWRWGRPLPVHDIRQKQIYQYKTSMSLGNNSPSEVGLLFLRRRQIESVSNNQEKIEHDSKVKKEHIRLLLIDLQVEQDEIVLSHHSIERKKNSYDIHFLNDNDNNNKEEEDNIIPNKEDDILDRILFSIQANIYEDLINSVSVSLPPILSKGLSFIKNVMYPAGASANSAFVQHILRYFTTRYHEKLHDTLLNEVQGFVSPLIKNEIEESIACLFFPYGQNNSNIENSDEKNNKNNKGTETVVFNKYLDGIYSNLVPTQLPFIRPRTLPEEPPLFFAKLLPAKLVLEIMRCLHSEQLRHAEEIGLELDDDDNNNNSDKSMGEDCLGFNSLRQVLKPISRTYIRDNIGDLALIPLLVSCFPQYFRVPIINVTSSSWSSIGLTSKGRQLVRQLEESSSLINNNDGSLSYRSRNTGCFFTDDTQQQLNAYYYIILK